MSNSIPLQEFAASIGKTIGGLPEAEKFPFMIMIGDEFGNVVSVSNIPRPEVIKVVETWLEKEKEDQKGLN